MRVEVLIKDRVGNFHPGQVAELDDESILFKALMNGRKAEVVNPPDWPDGKEEVVVESVAEEIVEEVIEDGESDNQQSSDGESSSTDAVSPKRPRRKSRSSSSESSGSSSEGYGGFGPLSEGGEEV